MCACIPCAHVSQSHAPLLHPQPLLLQPQHLCLQLTLHRLVELDLLCHLVDASLLCEVTRAHALVEQLQLPPQASRLLLVAEQLGHLPAKVGDDELPRLGVLPQLRDLRVELRERSGASAQDFAWLTRRRRPRRWIREQSSGCLLVRGRVLHGA